MRVRNLKHLNKKLQNDQKLQAKFKADPIDFLKNEVQEDPPMMNKFVFLTIVCIVTGILVYCLWVAFKIEFFNDELGKYEVPEYIIGFAGTCLGAIAGLLAPSPIK